MQNMIFQVNRLVSVVIMQSANTNKHSKAPDTLKKGRDRKESHQNVTEMSNNQTMKNGINECKSPLPFNQSRNTL